MNSSSNAKKFLDKGYLIVKLDKKEKIKLNKIKKTILNLSSKFLKKKITNSFIKNTHEYISSELLNKFRLSLFNNYNNENFSKNFVSISRAYLDQIVGNELAMQKKINLSIQLPNDDSSLLPIHSDTWAGDSPFEVVVWIPLSNVYLSNAMFILPYDKFKKIQFNKINFKNNDQIYKSTKKYLKFIKMNYGEILIFNQNLPHGNIVNKTKITRWSFNCRFKSLFSPYHEKEFMQFFKPVSIKPATIFGINYEYPKFQK